MSTQSLTYRVTMPQFAPRPNPVQGAQAQPHVGEAGRPESFGGVSPRRLIALGILANLMFWGGLLTPYNVNAYPVLTHLHASVMMLGVGLALGGAAAAVMVVVHRVTVRLFSPELTAAVLHFTVGLSFAVLSLKAAVLG